MKKSYLFALPMMIGVVGLTACDQASNPPPADKPTEKTDTAVSEPASNLPDDAPVVHVAMSGVDEPFTFKDEKGSLTGIEYDIITAVGESQGFKVEPIVVPFEGMLSGLEAKNFDLIISAFGYSDERASKYGLSKPYFYAPSSITYINPELNIKNYKDLAGKSVAVSGGSFLEKDLSSKGIAKEIVPLETSYLMLQGLVQGKFDAIAYDQTMLQYTFNKYPEIQEISVPYFAEKDPSDNLVMIMHKDNTELLEKVNKGIDEISANGKLDEISQKWLGVPAPR